MVGFGGVLFPRDRGDVTQQQRVTAGAAVDSAFDRDIAQRLERIDVALGILRGEEIVIAGFGIDP